MKLDVDDCCDLPTSDAVHLSDHLIRFRFQRPRAVSQNLRFILEEGHSIATLFPDAPNRSAVEHNLRVLRKSLDRAYEREREKKGPFPIQSSRDYALFNVEHHCNPAFLYTNGQAAASLVERTKGGFEVALHRELREFLAFCDEYGTPNFISWEQVRRFGTLVEAELWVREQLSEVRVSIVPMFRGDSSASLTLQRVGERRGDRGRETVFSWTFLGEKGTVRIGGAREAYGVLNELEFDGYRVQACATCRSFRFSGMSRDMSNGSRGYCTLHAGIDPRTDRNDLLVSVYSLCPNYEFLDDADRARPYLAKRNDPA